MIRRCYGYGRYSRRRRHRYGCWFFLGCNLPKKVLVSFLFLSVGCFLLVQWKVSQYPTWHPSDQYHRWITTTTTTTTTNDRKSDNNITSSSNDHRNTVSFNTIGSINTTTLLVHDDDDHDDDDHHDDINVNDTCDDDDGNPAGVTIFYNVYIPTNQGKAGIANAIRIVQEQVQMIVRQLLLVVPVVPRDIDIDINIPTTKYRTVPNSSIQPTIMISSSRRRQRRLCAVHIRYTTVGLSGVMASSSSSSIKTSIEDNEMSNLTTSSLLVMERLCHHYQKFGLYCSHVAHYDDAYEQYTLQDLHEYCTVHEQHSSQQVALIKKHSSISNTDTTVSRPLSGQVIYMVRLTNNEGIATLLLPSFACLFSNNPFSIFICFG
jgi:hypothetical protein